MQARRMRAKSVELIWKSLVQQEQEKQQQQQQQDAAAAADAGEATDERSKTFVRFKTGPKRKRFEPEFSTKKFVVSSI